MKIPAFIKITEGVRTLAARTRTRLTGKQWTTRSVHDSSYGIETFCMMGAIYYSDPARCPNGRIDWKDYDNCNFTEDERNFVFLLATSLGWDKEKRETFLEVEWDLVRGSIRWSRALFYSAENVVTDWNDAYSTDLIDYKRSKKAIMAKLRQVEKVAQQ